MRIAFTPGIKVFKARATTGAWMMSIAHPKMLASPPEIAARLKIGLPAARKLFAKNAKLMRT